MGESVSEPVDTNDSEKEVPAIKTFIVTAQIKSCEALTADEYMLLEG